MSEHNDLESRLRDALRTEGDSARVSPDALGKIRGRIERPRRKRSHKHVIAFGVMAGAAACTAAIIVVPQVTGGAHLQSASAPESNAKQQDSDPLRLGTEPTAPTPRETESSESGSNRAAQAAPVLGELVVGKDINVSLLADITGDTATAQLTASKWDGSKWGPQQGRVRVGEPGALTFSGSLSGHVCEFRVVQAPGKPATVRVRLAQQSGGACSDAYVYELDGTTLKPKQS